MESSIRQTHLNTPHARGAGIQAQRGKPLFQKQVLQLENLSQRVATHAKGVTPWAERLRITSLRFCPGRGWFSLHLLGSLKRKIHRKPHYNQAYTSSSPGCGHPARPRDKGEPGREGIQGAGARLSGNKVKGASGVFCPPAGCHPRASEIQRETHVLVSSYGSSLVSRLASC